MTGRVGRSVLHRPARRSGAGAPIDADGGPDLAARRPASIGRSTSPTLGRLLDELSRDGFPPTGSVVLGGGCAGLALAVAVAEEGGAVAVVDARAGELDGRTWCYWDTGEALLPEAVSRSWDRWEIRTPDRAVVASDPRHPYRMVRAHDYRAAAGARLARASRARLIPNTRVSTPESEQRAERPRSPRVFDARGAVPTRAVPAGRVLLHQRFVGRWVRTARAVFDTSTATLMDFPEVQAGHDVRFFYVLPVEPDLALVECTVFSSVAHGDEPFRQHIAEYIESRWGLGAHEWTAEGRESGSIPMTDARPDTSGQGVVLFGLRAGIARPSTGYAYTRIQVAARRQATAMRDDAGSGRTRDRLDVRILDAIFLRFLRDRPHLAPAVFLRMFERLPGPLTVRFLTERAGLLDEVRLILALPKAPFLRAAAATAAERLAARTR